MFKLVTKPKLDLGQEISVLNNEKIKLAQKLAELEISFKEISAEVLMQDRRWLVLLCESSSQSHKQLDTKYKAEYPTCLKKQLKDISDEKAAIETELDEVNSKIDKLMECAKLKGCN